MKKLLIALFFTSLGLVMNAQQDAIYSQYMFNPFVINPAYAGSRHSISAVLLHRSQWVGMDGAPTTSTFSIHSPFKGTGMAAGISAIADRIGPSKNLAAFATFAYHLRLGVGDLSFGLRGGMYSTEMDGTMLDYRDPTDQFNTQLVQRVSKPSFDFGMYYYTNRFFIGASATHITQENLTFSDFPDNAEMVLDRHIMLTSGYAMDVNENVIFKPSVMVRYVNSAPINFDVNASFLFKRTLWLGASYRMNNSIAFITEYNVTDNIRLGYSFDMTISELKRYNSGTHELFVGFDFSLTKEKSVSTRLL